MMTPKEVNDHGFTVTEICRLIGISRPHYYEIMNNNSLTGSRAIIIKAAHVWGRITERDPREIYIEWAERQWDNYDEQRSTEGFPKEEIAEGGNYS